ncbi:hypothetical protein [Streptomyces sp. NPDC048436]|uniref:hypothetical protein n=1 Tax=Streptomyces sp. NPDC048436 TaxID=3365550 RepID=UPI00371E2C3A
MKTFSDFTSPPSDYNVIVPDGWFQLPLDPDDRDRAIIALADQQFRGVDNAPHLKQQFMREMQRRAKRAYGVGARSCTSRPCRSGRCRWPRRS